MALACLIVAGACVSPRALASDEPAEPVVAEAIDDSIATVTEEAQGALDDDGTDAEAVASDGAQEGEVAEATQEDAAEDRGKRQRQVQFHIWVE